MAHYCRHQSHSPRKEVIPRGRAPPRRGCPAVSRQGVIANSGTADRFHRNTTGCHGWPRGPGGGSPWSRSTPPLIRTATAATRSAPPAPPPAGRAASPGVRVRSPGALRGPGGRAGAPPGAGWRSPGGRRCGLRVATEPGFTVRPSAPAGERGSSLVVAPILGSSGGTNQPSAAGFSGHGGGEEAATGRPFHRYQGRRPCSWASAYIPVPLLLAPRCRLPGRAARARPVGGGGDGARLRAHPRQAGDLRLLALPVGAGASATAWPPGGCPWPRSPPRRRRWPSSGPSAPPGRRTRGHPRRGRAR